MQSSIRFDEAVAQGSDLVRFNKPLIHYVENFLGFPVGIPAPVGYYDKERAVWVASDSGRVIGILGIVDGLAQLDVDGSGSAADGAALAALGITDDELRQLAALYQPGQSLWRVQIPHFSTWDINWGWGPPPDAEFPNQPPPKGNQPLTCPNKVPGSIVECQGQILGEQLPVAGTPYTLNYRSDRVPDYQVTRSVEISLTGNKLPPGVIGVALEVTVVGRTETLKFPPEPNQEYTYLWDGKDAYGRLAYGRQMLTIRIGYIYPRYYQVVARFGYNGGGNITGNSAAADITLWQTHSNVRWQARVPVTVNNWDVRGQSLGGWELDIHHTYDLVGRVLYLGSGQRRDAENISGVISTVAGGGGTVRSSGIITETSLFLPTDIALRDDGSFFITDGDHRILYVDISGAFRTVAGIVPQTGFSGDGGPANQALLNGPAMMALAPDGTLYFTDRQNQRIRMISPSGIITTVAGTGVAGYNGDGIPALQAQLNNPYALALGPDGSLYFGDYSNYRVRRIGTDGIITTVAGTGTQAFTGDNQPAVQASLEGVYDIALAPDGSLYIAEISNNRVRLSKVTPDGIFHVLVSPYVPGSADDEGLPISVDGLHGLISIAFDRDGSYFVSQAAHGWLGKAWDMPGHTTGIRFVNGNGTVTTISGHQLCLSYNYCYPSGGDGGLATQATFSDGVIVAAVGPDHSIYAIDPGPHRIRRIYPVLPGFSDKDIVIPSEDGMELYGFDRTGRHTRTISALTEAELYRFAYDGAGRLLSVTDGSGNVTTIERNGGGAPVAIVSPFGQRTALGLNPQGFLATVTNPAGETTELTYTPEGLLTSLTDARQGIHRFGYDRLGRLISDTDPENGALVLERVDSFNAYTVTLMTSMGRQTSYKVEDLPNGTQRRVNTAPDGTQTQVDSPLDGSFTAYYPDGQTVATKLIPDPRYGMQAPYMGNHTVKTAGKTATVTRVRSVTLANPAIPSSVIALNDRVTVNGRQYVSTYNLATRTFTDTTPTGRRATTVIDVQGRVIREQVAGLLPTNYTYNARGRLETIVQGAGAEQRITRFVYNAQSYLASITDPLNRTVTFTYDGAGRVLQQTMPDGRVIAYTYDANSNLTSLTPPGRPSHSFTYTPVDLEASYTPPDIGIGNVSTTNAFNLDRQVTQVALPTGQTLNFGYDAAGRLSTLTFSRGTLRYGYDTAGRMNTISAPGSVTLSFAYDGSLLTSETWSGAVAGSVSRAYDNDFRIASLAVNGVNTVTHQYDADGLLIRAGDLTLTRNAQNGLLTGSMLGNITDTWSYNGFGEPLRYTAVYNGSPLYDVQLTRDSLGRITTKTEAIGGTTEVYAYAYDLAGRLAEVRKNGALTTVYTYDANGNRLTYTGPGGTIAATYDAQDRLLQYGDTTYTYTAKGELLTKTTGGQTTSYKYDELGDLIHASLPDGTQIDYLVDGSNRRIEKLVDGILVQRFLYLNKLNPIAEVDGSGNLVTRFIYGSRPHVPEYAIKDGVTYRILSDNLGSPRMAIDVATGLIAQRTDYDEFGQILLDSRPGFLPFGFAGGIFDQDTGLSHFGVRDFDASVGRWLSRDTARFAGSDANLYAYVANDPVNHFDPLGFSGWVERAIGQYDSWAIQWAESATGGFRDPRLWVAFGLQSMSTLIDWADRFSPASDALSALDTLTDSCKPWLGSGGKLYDLSANLLAGSVDEWLNDPMKYYLNAQKKIGYYDPMLRNKLGYEEWQNVVKFTDFVDIAEQLDEYDNGANK